MKRDERSSPCGSLMTELIFIARRREEREAEEKKENVGERERERK